MVQTEKFKKNDLLKTNCEFCCAYRLMTQEESDAWYLARRGQIRDDGESYISSGWKSEDVSHDLIFVCTRARCSKTIGWNRMPKMVEVIEPKSGHTMYIRRADLTKV